MEYQITCRGMEQFSDLKFKCITPFIKFYIKFTSQIDDPVCGEPLSLNVETFTIESYCNGPDTMTT